MATKGTRIARLVGAVLLMLLASIFVQAYSEVQGNILQHGARIDYSALPWLCQIMPTLAVIGYALCALLFVVGLVAVLRQKHLELTHEICVQVAQVGAAFWVLACLTAWWLPHAFGISPVR